MAAVVLQSMSWPGAFLLASVLAFILIFYFVLSRYFPRKMDLRNCHVLVTGGSSGIGLACAAECVRRGANVTLVARNTKNLEMALSVVQAARSPNHDPPSRVNVLSCDVGGDFRSVETAFASASVQMGLPVDVLINCVGAGPAAAFDEMEVTEFERLMRVNYLTAVHATRAVLPSMKSRKKGRIVFVSSQAGQLGLFGYTAYSASKFALRGLAEALQMEVKPFKVFITMAFPPDTDTPGFAEDSKEMPPETKEISATSGLFSSPEVARKMIDSVEGGDFLCCVGLDGFMLGTLTAGMAPVTSFFGLVLQAVCMSVFRIVGAFYLASFDGICQSWKMRRDEKKTK